MSDGDGPREALERDHPGINACHSQYREDKRMPKDHARAQCRERGAIGIMTALLLPLLIGFVALTLELAQIYNRKAEMQAVAEGLAMSAARKLNGTSQGVADALAAAQDLVASGAKSEKKLHFRYHSTMTFLDAAIKFSTSPDGTAAWVGAEAAKAAPAGLAYARVDTHDLDADYGTVKLLLIRVLATVAPVQLSHVAIAGRQRLNVMPLAICDMSKDPAQPFKERKNADGLSELTEYGFRRGISYNLLKLSPHTTSAVHYMIDPISLPPRSGNFTTAVVGPYICNGTVELPRVIGQTLNLQSTFPVAQFVNHLNSRFNSFNATNKECSANGAPPDSNIRSFAHANGNINWMTNPGRQVAEPAPTPNRMETVADVDPSNPSSATHYGPLWVFARAVPWSSYKAGEPEPAGGYVPFEATTAIWKSLYSPGPGLTTYPTDSKTKLQSPPYFTTQAAGAPATNYPGVMYRRVLNVPLLSCPAGAPAGAVLAIGRFFMTVPADSNGIYAEFAGATLQEQVSGPVELYQ
jgi:hypothetical protein